MVDENCDRRNTNRSKIILSFRKKNNHWKKLQCHNMSNRTKISLKMIVNRGIFICRKELFDWKIETDTIFTSTIFHLQA